MSLLASIPRTAPSRRSAASLAPVMSAFVPPPPAGTPPMPPTVSISSTPDRSIAAIAPETPLQRAFERADRRQRQRAGQQQPGRPRIVLHQRILARHHPSRVSYGEIFACRQGSRVGQRAAGRLVPLHRSMAAGMGAKPSMPELPTPPPLAHHFRPRPTIEAAGTTTGKPMGPCFARNARTRNAFTIVNGPPPKRPPARCIFGHGARQHLAGRGGPLWNGACAAKVCPGLLVWLGPRIHGRADGALTADGLGVRGNARFFWQGDRRPLKSGTKFIPRGGISFRPRKSVGMEKRKPAAPFTPPACRRPRLAPMDWKPRTVSPWTRISRRRG